jgi:phosphoribosylformimino-5-aminoimidazole carboxamide ribotide isomerase
MEDIQTLGICSGNRLDVTVGSALDLFGGSIPFEKLKNLDETKMYENSPE